MAINNSKTFVEQLFTLAREDKKSNEPDEPIDKTGELSVSGHKT